MRVTYQGVLSSILTGLQRNITRLEDYQTRVSAGKRVMEPSDDPAATVKILDLRTQMAQATQYKENAEDGMDWLGEADNVLSQVESTMVRVREIAVSVTTGTNDNESYKAYAEELDTIIRGLSDMGNATIGNLRLFAGQNVNSNPIDVTPASGAVTGVTYNGGNAAIMREIAPGVQVQINITADQFLVNNNLLPALVQLRQSVSTLGDSGSTAAAKEAALQFINGDPATATPGVLDTLQDAEDSLLTIHTDIGAREKRLEAASNRADAVNDGLTKLISKQEDIDVPKALLELATVNASYQLSLQMGAKIVQPTLLDFLK